MSRSGAAGTGARAPALIATSLLALLAFINMPVAHATGSGPSPATDLPMPGFAAYEQIQMSGGEMAATVFTPLSCDALAGWLQAGDWRLEGDAVAPLASAPPEMGAVVPPRTRWLVLTRPGDAAVAKLVTDDEGSGCWATVSRLSRRSLSAEGAFAATTSALAYQLVCVPDTMSVLVATFFVGDDGTRAIVVAEVPLILGDQALLDGSVQVGRVDVTLATLTESFTRSLDEAQLEQLWAPSERFELEAGGTGSATVTSIDPFIATIAFDGLIGLSGATQSLTVDIGCDLPRGQLAAAAIPPEVTPPPTVAPGGSMELTVGSGADGIAQTLAGPQITCSFGIMGAHTWFLSHDDGGTVTVFLFAPADGSATFNYYDFRPAMPIQVDIDPPRTGGNLTVTVDDRGSEVGFTATGVTGDGRPVSLSSTCRAIERL